jgi:low affinity Fe/Cu permease
MAARGGLLERISKAATEWTGTSLAFALAVTTIVVWAVTGPLFGYSDTWQLVINTGTTIVTFLMVFLIQRAQNKDSAAIHLKLNELVASLPWASNRLISAEDLSEDEVKVLREHFRKLVELAKAEADIRCSHSIEEAEADHSRKKAKQAADGSALRRRKKRGGRRHRKGGARPNCPPDAPPKPPHSNNEP